MRDGIKLTEAIEGNRNWLRRSQAMHEAFANKANELEEKARILAREMAARERMAAAMEEVQSLFPGGETITFLVPND